MLHHINLAPLDGGGRQQEPGPLATALETRKRPAGTWTSVISSPVYAMATKYKQVRTYRRTVHTLSALADQDLKDLGLSRSMIRRVARQTARQGQ